MLCAWILDYARMLCIVLFSNVSMSSGSLIFFHMFYIVVYCSETIHRWVASLIVVAGRKLKGFIMTAKHWSHANEY